MASEPGIETAAADLRRRLAGRLEEDGWLRSPTWRAAVEAVPRHVFLPRFYRASRRLQAFRPPRPRRPRTALSNPSRSRAGPDAPRLHRYPGYRAPRQTPTALRPRRPAIPSVIRSPAARTRHPAVPEGNNRQAEPSQGLGRECRERCRITASVFPQRAVQ